MRYPATIRPTEFNQPDPRGEGEYAAIPGKLNGRVATFHTDGHQYEAALRDDMGYAKTDIPCTILLDSVDKVWIEV